MRTALVFPGQGAQRPGMLAALGDHPAVAATRAEAGDVLGCDWRVFDEAATLARTDGAQIALAVAGVAAARALAAEGAAVDAVCGHSVGAFPSAVAAGVLSFADALKLVALRGRLMAESHPHGFGMTAILGLREPKVAALVEEAREAGPLYVSNRNAALQIVVSGADAALERVAALALDAGARKATRLCVATPSHSPLVAPVADELRAGMAGVEFHSPRLAYVSARRARVLKSAADIAEDLASNVAAPVEWRDAARLMGELGIGTFLEAPPGTTLTDLIAEELPDARAVALESVGWASAARAAARPPEGVEVG